MKVDPSHLSCVPVANRSPLTFLIRSLIINRFYKKSFLPGHQESECPRVMGHFLKLVLPSGLGHALSGTHS